MRVHSALENIYHWSNETTIGYIKIVNVFHFDLGQVTVSSTVSLSFTAIENTVISSFTLVG